MVGVSRSNALAQAFNDATLRAQMLEPVVRAAILWRDARLALLARGSYAADHAMYAAENRLLAEIERLPEGAFAPQEPSQSPITPSQETLL